MAAAQIAGTLLSSAFLSSQCCIHQGNSLNKPESALCFQAPAATTPGGPGRLLYKHSRRGSKLQHSITSAEEAIRKKAARVNTRASMAVSEKAAGSETRTGKAKFYDAPLSNNGARVRFVIYGKGLEDDIEMAKPADLGGLKSPEYLALNPEGKMPLLVTPDGQGIPESKVISEYLCDLYKEKGPSFEPDAENKVTCSLLERIHDLYIAGNQGAMYRALDATAREGGLREIAKQLRILERYAKADPYLAGPKETTADHAVFPTMVFIDTIMPQVYGWTNYLDDKPKLKKWWSFMKEQPIGKRIYDEVHGALTGWLEGDRFEKVGVTEQLKEDPERFKLHRLEAAN